MHLSLGPKDGHIYVSAMAFILATKAGIAYQIK